jgi:signal transduction histidine kinase/ligand-binding sensor domain-containing protein
MRFVCITLLTLVSLATPAAAQYRFESWTADTGLPQNIITGLHQGSDGYLWIATLDGLARFDGVRFTIFNKANSPGIQSNRFTSLYADQRGDLWLSTEGGSVTRYSRQRFVTYTTVQGLAANVAWGFTGDAAGNVWVLSGEQISRWDPIRERFVAEDVPKVSRGYAIMTWSARGGFWGLAPEGVRRFVGGMFELYPAPAAVIADGHYCAEDQDGTIRIATADGRVVHVGRRTGPGRMEWSVVGPGAAVGQRALHMDWRTPSGRSLPVDLNYLLHRSVTLASSTSRQTVAFSALVEDRDGNLWLGTDGDGLFAVRKEVVKTYSEAQGLVARNVYPIIQARDGAIWIGAWAGGLSRFKDGTFTNYTPRDGIAPTGVTALHEDRDGRLWIATNSGGLQTFHNGRFAAVERGVVPDGSVVKAIHQDRSGAIWLGTQYGVVRHQGGGSKVFSSKDGLAGDDVRVIVESRTPGRLWFGTYVGLTRWQDGTLTRWTREDGLPATTVRAIYEDDDGILWIGTYDGGLLRFDGRRFTHVTTRDGLFSDGVFQVLEDGRGYLWMSSNRGISRVRKQELNELAAGSRHGIVAIAYGKGDGMLNVECNGGLWPAGVEARDGSLWFPTQDGVAVIDPGAVPSNPHPPPVVIESFLLDREPIVPVPSGQPLRLAPGRSTFEIGYTSLSFINPEHVRFKYRLDGLDGDWVDASTRRTAYYSHVPPGNYTFTVIAANSDGVWNRDGSSLAIVVLPPYYRTWWFLTLLGVAIGALVVLTLKRREARLMRARAEQQAFTHQLIASQEAERKRIAAELHDSLGQRLVVIKNLAVLASTASPDAARERVVEIAGEAHHAIAEVREISQNLRPSELDRVGLTKALTGLVRKARGASAIALTADVDAMDGVFAKDEEVNVYRVVQESLNNVLKHSGATKASLTVRRAGPRVQIAIEDNGRGFLPSNDSSGTGRHAGFGLIGIAERVSLLGGRSEIHSAPGQGTRIDITFDRL